MKIRNVMKKINTSNGTRHLRRENQQKKRGISEKGGVFGKKAKRESVGTLLTQPESAEE